MESKKRINKKGLLIAIEGVDSSGKATQTKILFEKMKNENRKVMMVEFPDYKSNSSALIKMYLNGDFGKNPNEVNPYAASVFFAADRFASFNTSWKGFYEDGGIIICDRYVTSNMIYQAAKFKSIREMENYLDWLADLEFEKLELPEPDIVVFLNIPPGFCFDLIKNRMNKITGEKEKDIHEKNEKYIKKTYDAALIIAEKYKWKILDCIEDGQIMSIEKISSLIKCMVDEEIMKTGFKIKEESEMF